MRTLGAAALVAATVLALTACGSQSTPPTRTATVTVAPAPSATSSAAATPAPTSSPSETAPDAPEPTATPAGADPGRPADQCTDIGVSVVPADGGGGAGSQYFDVLFTNTGGTTCALRGTPGVSVVGDGNGTQLGKAADRLQTGVKTLTLRAGDTVAAPLKVVNIGTDGGPLDGCTVQRGDGYRVYPPHSTTAFLYSDPKAVACVKGPSFMTVGPVIARTD